ncbi:MAG TPA: Rne/Rng family ribonuclease [Planctomycetota bacterium]|nr:Rne/Rng family ribonuclease [Planctomycetota bacterium]
MGREILLDLRDPEEGRSAVLEDGRLAELAVETEDRRRRQGDVYLGRVVRVEPSVEAAFVDIGAEKAGFLHADDVMPVFAGGPPDPGAFAARQRGSSGRIANLLHEGQSILVQVTRDSLGTKGPTLTTHVSLPGRWLVLMPSLERVGVSRRVSDPDARERVRAAFASLDPPPGMGYIVRTAGADRDAADLRREMEALQRVFLGLAERARTTEPPALLLREGSLVVRSLRDWLAHPVESVAVEGREAFEEARAFLAEASPPWADRLRLHEGPAPLFHERGVEEAVDRLFERRVPIPGGGFLLIEPTEALVAVDVNSGKAGRGEDLEETALDTDLRAAAEIGRQLRLRDLGGLIVVDFIDVRRPENREAVNRAVEEAFREDRARVRFTPLSEFGLVEITRRRTGPSLRQVLHEGCPSCRGRGVVRTAGSAALRALREVRALRASGRRDPIVLRASADAAGWLRERRRDEVASLGARIEETRDLPRGGFEVE